MPTHDGYGEGLQHVQQQLVKACIASTCKMSITYLDNITARVAVLPITIRVRRTVPALVYALALALLRLAVHSGADPYDVVGGEPGPILF